jgi:thioredoxin reductase (NADPH)
MQRTPLAASHVQALRDAGKTVTHPVGAILARSGEPITSFIYVEEGEVEVINPYTNAVCPSRSAQPNSWAKSRY